MRKVVAAVLVVALVAAAISITLGLLLSGGADPAPQPAEPRTEIAPEPGSDEPPEPGLGRFYGQRLAWSRCGSDECARLTVPLDYDRPGGRTIELAVLRVRAEGQPQGSLVVNPGGYIGESTSREIAYAHATGKPITFTDPV